MHVLDPLAWDRRLWCSGAGHGLGGCGALLLVEEADLLLVGERELAYRCPVCGVLTDTLDRLPSYARQRVLARLRKPGP